MGRTPLEDGPSADSCGRSLDRRLYLPDFGLVRWCPASSGSGHVCSYSQTDRRVRFSGSLCRKRPHHSRTLNRLFSWSSWKWPQGSVPSNPFTAADRQNIENNHPRADDSGGSGGVQVPEGSRTSRRVALRVLIRHSMASPEFSVPLPACAVSPLPPMHRCPSCDQRTRDSFHRNTTIRE